MFTYTIRVRRFVQGDMERVKEIEEASMRYLTPLSSLSIHYEIVPEGFLVAEVKNRVVGFIIANIRCTQDGRKEVHILSIAVDPMYRRQGIGAALIRNAIKVFKVSGVSRIGLEVNVKNMDARRFYTRLGFKEAHIIRRYYRMRGYSEDAVAMVKDIRNVCGS